MDLEQRVWQLEEQRDVLAEAVEKLMNAIISHRLRVMESEKDGYKGPNRIEFDRALWLVPGMIRGGGCPSGCPCGDHR
ncbi:MAG: hypothetical protein RLY50_38 [Actinomycetota bacterium]|jgi:hypothetical protein